MKLSTYYKAIIEFQSKRLDNPKLDEVAKAGARIEIESCKEELKKIQNGEVKDEEI